MKIFKIPQSDPNLRFMIHSSGKCEVIPIDHILYCEGCGNYISIHVNSGKTYLSCCSLGTIRQQLESSGFILANRSELVNLKHIHAFYFKNDSHILLSNGKKISISRRRKINLLRMVSEGSFQD